jgi:glyoxylase-like metal-dependent hydrolase (beta-lactamase superfamily II)
MASVTTIDTGYYDIPRGTAAYLLREGDRAAFVETNTSRAVPRLLEALRAEGLAPAQVEYVVITHVHLDHAGGAAALLQACPNATLLAHPRAAKHVIDPSKLVKSARQVYGDAEFERLYGEIAPVDPARVRVMEDGERLAFGSRELTFFYTRGHANHHLCVHDSGSDAVFTGDAFGVVYPDLQRGGRLAIPSTSPTDFDAAEAVRSLDAIRATGAERVYLTHFGGFDDLDEIAAQLRAQLEESGRIVEEAYEAGLEGEALEAFCARRVDAMLDARLAERGLKGHPDVDAALALDRSLNAQGLAFAVQKRRFKERQAPR